MHTKYLPATVLTLLLALLVGGCSTPESEAEALGLKYAEADFLDASAQWSVACMDEQAARPLVELQTSRDELLENYPELRAKVQEQNEKFSYTASTVTVAEDGSTAQVAITISGGEKPDFMTVDLRRADDRWCVVTGWAEQARKDAEEARLQKVADEIEEFVATASGLRSEWKILEADRVLKEAESKLTELPPDHYLQTTTAISVEGERSLLTLRSEGWVGGRWIVRTETDPMTDRKKVFAHLESVDTMSGIVGPGRRATLILRCAGGKLETFISTPSMLDSHWRYDSVSGRHRFEKEPAAPLKGTRSSDYKAVFLRSPRTWLAEFERRAGQKWTVELPIYNKTPETVTFDLEASEKATAQVAAACPG